MVRHKKKMLVGVVALVAGGSLLGPGSSLASTPKTYTDAGTPTSIVGGVPTSVTITLANTTTSGDQDLGAAHITVPAGFTVTGSPVKGIFNSRNGAKPWPLLWKAVYNATTRNIELSGLDVDPGESISVSLTVGACSAGNYQWATDVRQSNQFSGTLNKLALVGADAVTSITQPCHLAFTGQPADTFPTATITTVKYAGTPNTPVAVTAEDGNNNPLTGWTTPIVLGVAGGDPTATLTGGGSVVPTSGVATFAPSLNKASDTAYQLTASSTGLATVSSSDFTVTYKAVVECTGGICSTPTVPSPGGGSAGATTDDGATGTFTLAWDPAGAEVPNCPNYVGMADTVFFNLVAAADLTGHTKTVTLLLPNDPSKSALSDYQVCYRAPYAFSGWSLTTDNLLDLMTSANPGAHPAPKVQSGPDRWQGLLFNCSLPGASAPCITSRATVSGGVQIVLKVPAGDPWAR